MRNLPAAIIQVLRPFERVFSDQLWDYVVELTAQQIVEWFVWRWQLEVTFEEARAHLGIETQRQWSDRAILRTTPALLGLFSLVTLLAQAVPHQHDLSVRTAAWYTKTVPTFSDT